MKKTPLPKYREKNYATKVAFADALGISKQLYRAWELEEYYVEDGHIKAPSKTVTKLPDRPKK